MASCGVVGESEGAVVETNPRRRRLDLRQFGSVADLTVVPPLESGRKRKKLDPFPLRMSASLFVCLRDCNKSCETDEDDVVAGGGIVESERKQCLEACELEPPRFGMTSVRGRRREMEDAVSIHPSFISEEVSFFGVFDGHGCSHVAFKCKDRLHEIVREEIASMECVLWKKTMERSFEIMDEEVCEWNYEDKSSNCKCEPQTPQCDAVGSTAVVAVVTPDKVVVSNCGDSRAVLCRNGTAVPLSSDHKPDRSDELVRIENAGGRVIYWDGPRVLGVLAMSRAIGDNYLKPYVISEPEVTVTERTDEDECLILASDGLWDVVSNDMACGVVRACLRAQQPASSPGSPNGDTESSDKACSDASILLTKLALARHSSDNVSVVVVDLRRKPHQCQSRMI